MPLRASESIGVQSGDFSPACAPAVITVMGSVGYCLRGLDTTPSLGKPYGFPQSVGCLRPLGTSNASRAFVGGGGEGGRDRHP